MKVSVVFGHKNQGKSQFLFFLAQLLKELIENVLYLDKSILPEENSDFLDSEDGNFCAKYWNLSKRKAYNLQPNCIYARTTVYREYF
jgi:hypothetical protein